MTCVIHQVKKIILLYLITFFILRKTCFGRKCCVKKENVYLLFLIVHISANFALDGPTFCMNVSYIHVEGTMSQIFDLGLGFYFMSKNG